MTQFQSAGVEAHRELIADLLMEITGAKTIFDRSDAATRQREGLPIRSELLRGEEPPAAIEVVEDGVRYGVDVRVGHKTGFYVDQRESRLTAQKVAEEFRRVHGRACARSTVSAIRAASLLHSSKGGAAEVVSVDSSQEALDMAAANARRNGFEGDCAKFVCKDVFTYLRELRDAGEKVRSGDPRSSKFASNHRHVNARPVPTRPTSTSTV